MEVAQPPPLPRPSLKKGRGSRHFSSLKIKLSPPFLRLPFRFPGLPHSRSLRASPGRPGPAVVTTAPRSLPRRGGGFRGPWPGGWPLGVGGRLLLAPAGARHRPIQRHVGGHPSPSAAGAGLRARPCPPAGSPPAVAAGRRSPGRARGVYFAPLAEAQLTLAGAARSAVDSSPLGSAPSSSPFLKGQRQGPAPPGARRASGPCLRQCRSAAG